MECRGRESDMMVGWEGAHDSSLMTDGEAEDGRHANTARRGGGAAVRHLGESAGIACRQRIVGHLHC